jgi:hypothetical protein
LLGPTPMARRVIALIGFVVVLALALLLLYTVFLHHTRTDPYDDGGPGAVVRLRSRAG